MGSRGEIKLGKINEITTRINSEQDLGSLLRVIMDTARELLSTEGASLLLHDPDTGELVFNVTSGETGELLHEKRIPPGEGIAGECAGERKPIIVNHADQDVRLFKEIDQQIGFNTRNLMAVPMLVRDKLVGVLEVVNTADMRDFSRRDLAMLAYLANMAALAINNRRLVRDLNLRIEEINCIYEISQSVHIHDEVRKILDGVLVSIDRVLRVDRLSVIIYDADESSETVLATRGFRTDDHAHVDLHSGVTGLVFKTGEPLLVRDYQKDLDFVPEFAGRYQTRSFISVPLIKGKQVIGVLSAADKRTREPFDSFEMKVLTTVAAQLADSLIRIQSRKHEARMAAYLRDVEMAARIQQNSLPIIPSNVAGLRVATRYRACRDVGGDFYDLLYHSENRISVLIADVAGKGVPAALFMEYSKTLLAGMIPRFMDPVSTLSAANQEIFQNSRMELYVTVMLVQLEREFRRLRVASAGHNHQMLVRMSEKKIEDLTTGGTPLGAFENVEYLERVASYESGDLLCLYTDGITEAEGREDFDFFGEERLQEAILKYSGLDPSEIIEKIFQEVADFQGGREASDDATLIVIRLS